MFSRGFVSGKFCPAKLKITISYSIMSRLFVSLYFLSRLEQVATFRIFGKDVNDVFLCDVWIFFEIKSVIIDRAIKAISMLPTIVCILFSLSETSKRHNEGIYIPLHNTSFTYKNFFHDKLSFYALMNSHQGSIWRGGAWGSGHFSILKIQSWSLFEKPLKSLFIAFLLTNFSKNFKKKFCGAFGAANS